MLTLSFSRQSLDSHKNSHPGELPGSPDPSTQESLTAAPAARPKRLLTLAVTLLLVPLGMGKLSAQQTPYPGYDQQGYTQPSEQAPQQNAAQPQPLTPEQLNQLVAPIALYPDTLVAQILAASTYPAQVADADQWRHAQAYSSLDQIVADADAQNWDPSVKSLTAFPQVLAMMDANLQWTTDLGNAYYNQPQDVLEAVQVMRQRAQASGNLRNAPQQTVTYNQGNIELAPPNPQVVYVPVYNPWAVYGQPVQPYPGFSLLGASGSALSSGIGSSLIRFGLGIAMAAFSHTPWGLLSWGLSWLTHSILFNNSDYLSQSTTVADWGFAYGGPRAFLGRHAFAGQPYNYNRTPASRMPGNRISGDFHRFGEGPRLTARSNETPRSNPSFGQRSEGQRSEGHGQGFDRPSERFPGNQPDRFSRNYQSSERSYTRPTQQAYNYRQSPAARPQQYSRPGYGNGFASDRSSTYARPETTYGRPEPGYGRQVASSVNSRPSDRAFTSSFQRGAYRDPSYRDPSTEKQSHGGGFHLFGHKNGSDNFRGGRAPRSFKAEKSFKPGKAFGKSFKPAKISHGGKSFGGHSHGGGGHFGGGHVGGGHFR